MEQKFGEAVEQLKRTIRDAAVSAVDTFYQTTGVCPSGMEIEMIDARTVMHEYERVVGSVQVSFDRM